MKKLLIAAVLLLSAVLAFAQPTVILHTGTQLAGGSPYTSRFNPFSIDATNRYSNVAMLYRTVDFTNNGASFPLTLTGIAFDMLIDPTTLAQPAGHQLGTLSIYVKTTALANLSVAQNWNSHLSGATLVYQSSTVDINGPIGWRQYDFNQNGNAFLLDGTANLEVICLYNEVRTPAPTSMGTWNCAHTQTTPTGYFCQRSLGTASAPAGTTNGGLSYWLPRTRFTLQAPAYAVGLASANGNSPAESGTTFNYSVTVTNNGQNADSYSLAVSGNTWPTTILDAPGGSVITTTSSIPSFNSTTVTVAVAVPAGTTPGQSDGFTLTATSAGSPGVNGTLSRTTTANYGPVLTTLQPNTHLMYNWIDPVAGGHTEASYTTSFFTGLAPNLDDDAFSHTLGESFTYYGTNYNTVGLGTNLQLVFSGTSGTVISNAINLWGLDGDATGAIGTTAKIYTYYDASAHKSVFTWVGWPEYAAQTNVYSAQVILDHANGSMKVQYNSFPGNYSTVGNYVAGPRAGLIRGSANSLGVVNSGSATISTSFGGGTMAAGNAFHIFNGNPTFVQNPTNPGGENSPGAFVPNIPGDPGTGGNPPVGISFPPQTGGNGNPGSVTVSYTTTRPPQIPGGSLPVANTIGRYFTITPSTSNFTGATLRLRFTTSDLPAGITDPMTAAPPLQAAYSVDGGNTWTGFTNGGTIYSLGAGVYEFVITGLNHFSMWALGNQGVLPVTLSSFTASAGNQAVTLQWRSESETNNASYQLYRSESREVLGTLIANVEGAGNSATALNYRYVDRNVTNGRTYYYRLSQTDLVGTITMLPIQVNATPNASVSVIPTEYGLHQNFPNPFNPSTTLAFDLKEAGDVSINIFDVTGRQVASVLNEQRAAGRYSVEFNASNLPAGVYFAKLQVNGFTEIRKMALVK